MPTSLRSYLTSASRVPTADLLKGVAVIFMIQVHLIELFANPDVNHSTIGRFSLFLGGPPAAPVFMAVMGYFLAATKKSLSQLMRRGLLLIIGGLCLNVGLNLNLLISISKGRFALDPLAYIFGADILPLAGLSVIIVAIVRPLCTQSPAAYFLMAIVVASLAPLLPNIGTPERPVLMYLNPFFWGDYSWSYFPLFPWLAYPLVGYAFKLVHDRFEFEKKLSLRVALVSIIVFVAGFLSTADYAMRISSDLPSYYHHGPVFALWTAFFLAGWTLLLFLAEQMSGQSMVLLYLKWLGRNVTAAYVIQWLLIGNIATEIYRTQSETQLLLWFILIVTLTSLLTALWTNVKAKLRLVR